MNPIARRSLAVTLALSMLASLSTATAVRAQNAFCDLLTAEEVGQALGGSVAATADAEGCTWATADAGDTFVFLSAYWDNLPFEERRQAFSTGTSVDVGEREAWFATDVGALYIQLDQGVLVLQSVASSEQIDLQAALSDLGRLVVDRAGALPTPAPVPTPMPMPSFEADADLEAMFPDTVGGEPLMVQSMTAEALFATADEDDATVIQQIEDALAAQGKSVADLSFGFAGNASGSIQAVRVAGGDASALTELFISALNRGEESEQSPGQVAGKDVIVVTVGGSTQYVYPQGEVIWVVVAQEPGLTEIFEALP